MDGQALGEVLLAFRVSGEPVSLSEAIRIGTEASLDEVFIARAGKVTAYDAATNTAVVQPSIKHTLFKTDGSRVFEEMPEIPFVPVMFPRVGDFVLSLPVVPGTPVLLLFLDCSHAEWRESGQVSEPADARRHSIGWPVAFVGLLPDTQPMSSDPTDVAARTAGMVLGRHGGDARIEIGSDIKLGKGATDFVALASKIEDELDSLRTWLNSHTHPTAGLGSPSTPSSPISAFNSVAASVTKAK